MRDKIDDILIALKKHFAEVWANVYSDEVEFCCRVTEWTDPNGTYILRYGFSSEYVEKTYPYSVVNRIWEIIATEEL